MSYITVIKSVLTSRQRVQCDTSRVDSLAYYIILML